VDRGLGYPRPDSTSVGSDMSDEHRVIRSLDQLVALLDEVDPPVFLRYSKGPEHDRSSGPSRDYEADVELPGWSVTNISPEPWWSRPVEDWLARRICKYLELGREPDRYPWLLTGSEVGRGPDHEPLVEVKSVLGRLDDALVEEAHRVYQERFDVGDDSTSDAPEPCS